METRSLDQLRVGLPACRPDGQQVGTITEVHREAPGGAMAPGMGSVRIRVERSDRTLDLDVPITRVLEVRPDCAVVELDPDLVARHDQQVKPEQYPG